MFSRISSRTARVARRFQSHTAHAEAPAAPFNNKHSFNLAPPPVHAYWNARNFSVLVAFVPVFLGAGYLGKYAGENAGGYDGLLDFADADKSPLKELRFGEAQRKN